MYVFCLFVGWFKKLQSFFRISISLYIPKTNVWEIQFLHFCHNLVLPLFSVCLPVETGMYGVSLWFCFTFPKWIVMSSIFSCAYLPSSSIKCLFVSFVHFLAWIFCLFDFLLLTSKSTLCIWDMSPSSDMCFINNSSKSIAFLIRIFCRTKFCLIFVRSNVLSYLKNLPFSTKSKNCSPSPMGDSTPPSLGPLRDSTTIDSICLFKYGDPD